MLCTIKLLYLWCSVKCFCAILFNYTNSFGKFTRRSRLPHSLGQTELRSLSSLTDWISASIWRNRGTTVAFILLFTSNEVILRSSKCDSKLPSPSLPKSLRLCFDKFVFRGFGFFPVIVISSGIWEEDSRCLMLNFRWFLNCTSYEVGNNQIKAYTYRVKLCEVIDWKRTTFGWPVEQILATGHSVRNWN